MVLAVPGWPDGQQFRQESECHAGLKG